VVGSVPRGALDFVPRRLEAFNWATRTRRMLDPPFSHFRMALFFHTPFFKGKGLILRILGEGFPPVGVNRSPKPFGEGHTVLGNLGPHGSQRFSPLCGDLPFTKKFVYERAGFLKTGAFCF